MKAWGFPAGVALGVLIAVGINCLPMDVEQDGGDCKYSPKGQGAWWHGLGFITGDQRVHCGRIRVTGDHWSLGHTDFGSMALAEDAIGDGTGKDPHWSARGWQEVQGVTAGVFDKLTLDRFTAALEGGAFLYDSHVTAIAYHWASGIDRYINPKHRQGVAPYARASVSYAITRNWSVGVALERYFGVRFNQWSNGGDETGGGDHIGPAKADITARMITVGYAFK